MEVTKAYAIDLGWTEDNFKENPFIEFRGGLLRFIGIDNNTLNYKFKLLKQGKNMGVIQTGIDIRK